MALSDSGQKRWFIFPARVGGIHQTYKPASRQLFRQSLRQGVLQDESYYRAALAGLYPESAARLRAVRPEVVADLLVDAVYAGNAVITDQPPPREVLVADAGALAAVAGGLALIDGPLPIGDVLALGVIIIGGGYLVMQSRNDTSSPALSRADEATIVDELVDRSCNARNAAAATDCWLYFHYTTATGFATIASSGTIHANRAGVVYITWLPLSADDVRTSLVFGQGNEGKGDYMVAFSKVPGVVFFPGESPNELKHQGPLRFGRHINVIYAGPNVLP